MGQNKRVYGRRVAAVNAGAGEEGIRRGWRAAGGGSAQVQQRAAEGGWKRDKKRLGRGGAALDSLGVGGLRGAEGGRFETQNVQ
jgi:hypothetical protein